MRDNTASHRSSYRDGGVFCFSVLALQSRLHQRLSRRSGDCSLSMSGTIEEFSPASPLGLPQ